MSLSFLTLASNTNSVNILCKSEKWQHHPHPLTIFLSHSWDFPLKGSSYMILNYLCLITKIYINGSIFILSSLPFILIHFYKSNHKILVFNVFHPIIYKTLREKRKQRRGGGTGRERVYVTERGKRERDHSQNKAQSRGYAQVSDT